MRAATRVMVIAGSAALALIIAVCLYHSRGKRSGASPQPTRSPPAHITVDLKDGQLMVDGEAGVRLAEYCRRKFQALADEGSANQPKRAPGGEIETRIVLALHPDLPYRALEEVLMGACRSGFFRFDLMLLGSRQEVRFEVPAPTNALPDGEHVSISILASPAKEGALDAGGLAAAMKARMPKYARLAPDGRLAVSEVAAILDIVTPSTPKNVVNLIPTPRAKSSEETVCEHGMSCTWSISSVETRRGGIVIHVPPDILKKAEIGDQGETPDKSDQK